MSEWQPISTAPRNGTQVDLWTKVSGRVPDCRWNAAKRRWDHWSTNEYDRMDWVPLGYPATHWMPLPEPPRDG